MPAFIDRTGQRFGQLTVISRSDKKHNTGAIWVCHCDCGNTVEVAAGSLASGVTKSCGCVRIKDLTNKKFNRLTVLSLSKNRAQNRGAIWLCRCDCGNLVEVRADSLISENTKSCGCFQKEKTREIGNLTGTHWATGTPEFNAWSSLLGRCLNPNNAAYVNYGGRGIQVCERWRTSFENFLTDMGPRPSSEHSIDRINNDGHYEPSNCRWATRTEQANNRRNNIFYNYNGVDYSLKQISDTYGIKPTTFHNRISQGWSIGDALSKPVK